MYALFVYDGQFVNTFGMEIRGGKTRIIFITCNKAIVYIISRKTIPVSRSSARRQGRDDPAFVVHRADKTTVLKQKMGIVMYS